MKSRENKGESERESLDYFRNVNIYDYDETIVAHPYMEQIKSAIIERVILHRGLSGDKTKVLDLGCGSGQLARALLGLSNIEVELCDIDQESKEFCLNHPELKSVAFRSCNILDDNDVALLGLVGYDIVIALGVLHHVPISQRSTFLENCRAIASKVIIADEGLAEYSSEMERKANASCWYDFVISESERRGIIKLARLERMFKKSDVSSLRALTDDYKVSISEVIEIIQCAGLDHQYVRAIGDWAAHKGGMFLIEVR